MERKWEMIIAQVQSINSNNTKALSDVIKGTDTSPRLVTTPPTTQGFSFSRKLKPSGVSCRITHAGMCHW